MKCDQFFNQRSQSKAALQPFPAATITYLYTLSLQSPAAYIPGTTVAYPFTNLTYPASSSNPGTFLNN